MAKPVNLVAEATYMVPVEYETEIGRIIVRWAHFEDLVQQILWRLLSLSPALGRIALREPRIQDRLAMICEITELHGGAASAQWRAFTRDAAKLAEHRNLLAHSVWIKDDAGNWFVERTAGSYQPAARTPKVSRKAEPSAVEVTLPMLRSNTAGIETLIRAAGQLHDAASATPRT